jgi:peptidyl-prolyl cis-trans isomerase B (cyclophilin B)
VPTNRQRREAQRRHLERQLERRREREVKRRKTNLIISIAGTLVLIAAVVVVVVVATRSDDKKAPPAAQSTSSRPTTPTSSSTTPAAAPYPCTWTKSGTAAKKASVPSTTKPSKKGTVAMAVDTNQGALTFTLNRAAAPCAVESFVSLAAQKYFDNTPCHRLTTQGLYVLQCGDPTGTGGGGPGYAFNDELTGKESYTRGVLAMANGGANTNGSQFFIVYKNSQLSPNYTVFGTVTKGLNVVDKIAAKGSNPAGDGKPKLPVTVKTVRPAA